MTKLQMVLISGALGFAILNACGQANQVSGYGSTNLSEVDLQHVLTDTTKQVNDFYKAEGFPIPAPPPDLSQFRLKIDEDYQKNVGEFGMSNQGLVGAEILTTSGKFISFRNFAAAHAFQSSSKYPVAPPAKWTKEHAIEVAMKFAAIFLKPWAKSLGPPIAHYRWQGTSFDEKTGQPQWRAGMWTVNWMQQTPSGILYRVGGAAVNLSEEYGPQDVFIHFPAEYDDEHITPLAKDKALIEARKGLDKIVGWGPAKDLAGLKVEGEPDAELMIVQPNNLTSQGSIADVGHANQIKARLAWVVTYKVTIPSGQGDGKVSVYIDAEDGSFLGGYF